MLQKDVSNTDFHQSMNGNKGAYSSEYASIIPSYSTDSDESLDKDDIMDFENNYASSRCSQSSITCTPIPVHLSPCALYSGNSQRNGRSMQNGLDKISDREALDQDVLNIGESKTPNYKNRLVLGISQKHSFPKSTTGHDLHTDNNDEIYKTPKEFLTSSANNGTNFEVSTPNVTYKQINCNNTITHSGQAESNLTSYVDSLFGAEPASYIHDHQPLTLFWLPNSEISGLMRIPSLSCFQNSSEYNNSEKLYLTFTQYSVDIIQDVSEFKTFPFVPNHTPFIVIYSYSFKSMYFKVVPRSVNQTRKVKLTKNCDSTYLNGHTDAIDLSIDHDSSDANYVFYRSYLFGKDDNIDPNRLKIFVQRSNKINFDMRCLSVNSDRIDPHGGIASSNGVKKRKRDEYMDGGLLDKQDCSTDSESSLSSESSITSDIDLYNDSEIPDVLLTECKLLIGTEINDNIDGCNMSIANYRSESVIKKNFTVYLINGSSSEGDGPSKRESIGPLVKVNGGKVLYHANDLELSEGDSLDIKFPTIYTKHFEHDRITLFSDKVLKTCFNYMKSLAQENDLVITINNIAQFCPNIFWNLSLCGDIKTAIMELDPELLKSLYKRKRNKLVSSHDELHDNKKSLGYLDNNFVIMQDLFKRDADEKVRKLLEIEERNRANGKIVRITLNKHADDELIISTVMDDNGFIKKSMQLLTEKQKNVVYKECMKRNFYVPVHIKFTPEKGRGVYAAYKIHKDDFVMEYKGELVTEKVAKFRNQKYNKSTSYKGSFIFFFKYNGRRYGIDATEEDISFGPARLVNHSRRNPNIVPRTILSNNYPRLIFVAKRDIEWGEELLVDYGERDPEVIRENPWLLE